MKQVKKQERSKKIEVALILIYSNKNDIIREMDSILEHNDTVCAHRLCGAGNGGFFLAFSKRDTLKVPYDAVKVHVTPQGVSGVII